MSNASARLISTAGLVDEMGAQEELGLGPKRAQAPAVSCPLCRARLGSAKFSVDRRVEIGRLEAERSLAPLECDSAVTPDQI